MKLRYVFTFFAAVLLSLTVSAADSTVRPNIVFILIDDLRWDEVDYPFVKIPSIQRIAREGVRFRNAFVTTPLCSPSRASYLTGQYADKHGVTDNTDRSPRSHELITFPRLDNIEVVEAGFLTYEHQGNSAEFVYSRYALHHLPDFWKAVALARVHQVLRPGDVLRLWDVVYSFNPAEAGDRIEAWCSTGGTTPDEGWSRGELEEHVRDEHSTYTWLLEPMIQRSGFAIENAEFSADGIFAKYVLRRSTVAR
jgi:Sulfatase/Methyltransferase domain